MIKGLILYSYSAFSGGNILNQYPQIFNFILPFLLIFAVVFGLLSRINLFTQKGDDNKPNNAINAIIALATALMAMQFDFVSVFFSEIFPRLGVGLAILLVAIILLSLFLPRKKWVDYVFFGIGAVILIVILLNTSTALGTFGGGLLSRVNWYAWGPWIVALIVILIIIGATVPKTQEDPSSAFYQLVNPKKGP